MNRRVALDRLDIRVRGHVDDPRALARAIAEALAARLADVAPEGDLSVPTLAVGPVAATDAPAAVADAAVAAVKGGAACR